MNNRFLVQCLAVIAMLSLLLSGTMAQDQNQMENAVSASLQNVDGDPIGIVSFTYQEQQDRVLITADIENLPPGFHGFHIHTVGNCGDSGEGAFTAVGDHLNPDESNHPDHAGDLPPLLVTANGNAYLSVATDRFTLEDLFDVDGSAVIIHANSDNFAHIPERYGSPDEDTLNTGDAGERLACGVIERGQGEFEATQMADPTPAG